MSGRLTILPKKTYCPWNPANVERVLRDERLERERLEKEHSLLHEKERSKKRQRRREDESEGQHEQQQGHINLFPEAVKQANGSTTGTSVRTIINPGSETNGVLAVPLGGEEANNRKYGKLPFYMRPSPVGGESRDVDDYENNEVVAKYNAQHAIRNGVFRGNSTSSNAVVTGDVITSAIMADQYRHREESRKQKMDPTTRFMSSSKNNHTQEQPQIQQKPGGALATNEAVISRQATTHNLDKETHGSKSHFRRKRSRSRGHDGSENKKSKKRYHRGREDRGGSPSSDSDDGNDVSSSSSSLSDNNSSSATLSSSSSDRRSHHHHRSSRTKHKKQKSLKKCARKSHSKQQHESPSLRSKEDHHQRKKEKDKRKKRRHGRDESGNSAKDRSKRRRRSRHSSERSLKYEGCENNDDQRFVQNGNGSLPADEISNDTRKKLGELEELRRRRHAREAREMERERQVLMPSGGIL